MNDAKAILQRFETLKAVRTPWESLWADIATYACPRRAVGMAGTISSPGEAKIFDTTAARAVETNANGCLGWMSPMGVDWFNLTSEDGPDNFKKKLSTATRKLRTAVTNSRFYAEVHEFYLDRSGFGCAALYLEESKKGGRLNFQHWPTGSFVIAEDDEGVVDTVMREFELTARQMVQKFGVENVPEVVAKAYKEGGVKLEEKRRILQAIFPREEEAQKVNDANGIGPQYMPIADVYIDKATAHICLDGGHEEMPVFVSRYLEWGSVLGWGYGWSPMFLALPEARQADFLQKMSDALAEKMAFPPVMAPEELEGEVDPNAMGVTYFSQELAQRLPREWMTAGRYDIAVDRIKQRQDAINAALHVDLFQMFAALDKRQMTAREVAERASEKVIQFSPTFARLTTELFEPMLERAFGILFRQGKFGLPEEWADAPEPEIEYNSRIAQAIRSLPTIGVHRTLELLGGIVGIKPEAADNIDFDKLLRETALNEGLPETFLLAIEDRDKLREARAQAQAQAQQMAAMESMATAAGKAGNIKPESVMGQALKQAA